MTRKKRSRFRGRGPGEQQPGGGGGGGGGRGGHHSGGGPVGGGRRRQHQPRGPRSDNGYSPPPENEVGENGEPLPLEAASGILELHPNGYGFLRDPKRSEERRVGKDWSVRQ